MWKWWVGDAGVLGQRWNVNDPSSWGPFIWWDGRMAFSMQCIKESRWKWVLEALEPPGECLAQPGLRMLERARRSSEGADTSVQLASFLVWSSFQITASQSCLSLRSLHLLNLVIIISLIFWCPSNFPRTDHLYVAHHVAHHIICLTAEVPNKYGTRVMEENINTRIFTASLQALRGILLQFFNDCPWLFPTLGQLRTKARKGKQNVWTTSADSTLHLHR